MTEEKKRKPNYGKFGLEVTYRNGNKQVLDAGADFRIWIKGRFIDLKLEDVKMIECFYEEKN